MKREIKVAYLGPEGTYTHQAAEKYFKEYEGVPCSNLREVFKSRAKHRVIPFENSLGGGVGNAVDLLREKDQEVTGEVRLEINHVMASENIDIEEIKTVRSHPQALSQVSKIIEEKEWETVESSSTAQAASEIEEGEAAVCSRLAAELNGLEIIDEPELENSNITRFLVTGGKPHSRDKTSIIVEPGVDRPGLLHSILGCFAGHGINLSYIQSRPTKNGLGSYYFYIEAEESMESEDFRKAVKCLETYSDIKILGSYGEK